MSARRDEDRRVAPPKTVGHEVRDPVIEEVFLLVVLNEVPGGDVRAEAICRHGRDDCENHATETPVVGLDVVTNDSSPTG